MFLPLITAIPKAVLCGAQNVNPRKDFVTNYPSIEEAIKDILACNPQVIAFGEIHPDPGFTYKSTKARFAKEILPSLAKSGIKDLVLEHVLSDPQIESELKCFFSSKCELSEKDTPVLFNNIKYSDKQDLVILLYRCRELGIRVHAGGMTIAEADETTKNPKYSRHSNLNGKMMVYSGRATKRKIVSLLKINPKARLAIYGGIRHNNCRDSSEYIANEVNFGNVLFRKLGKKYVEVDILPKEEKDAINSFAGIKNWRNYIPSSGINLLIIGQKHTIFTSSSINK
jgi:hypothetical protein